MIAPNLDEIYSKVLNDGDLNQNSGMLYCMPIISDYIQKNNCKSILELGVGPAQSTILFAILMKKVGGKLCSIEIDPQKVSAAQYKINNYGLNDVATIILSDSNGATVTGGCDLIFIDSSPYSK